MNILQVQNITKYYDKKTKAISNINFDISQGEFVTILGPSGAGKSTILRCINRMIDVSSGDILFENKNIVNLKGKDLRKHRTRVAMVFQNFNLVEQLTVIENVLHGRLGYKSTLQGILNLYTQEEKNRALELLKILQLDSFINKKCKDLSSGQKQRVGIARALIQNPKMILCDEPIASLDPSSSKVIMDYLKQINRDMGITCILSLHHVDVAIKYSDKIIGINKGSIVYKGSSSNLSKECIYKIYGSETGNLITD